MPYKKIILPEVQEHKPEPKIQEAKIYRITPPDKDKKPIVVENDPSGWKKILLDGDPITALGREDLTSYAGLYSPNAAGVQVIAGVANKKIKVKAAGYHSTVTGTHYLYFGTSTTPPTLPTTKVFLVSLTTGHYRQTKFDPDVGAAGDGLYIYSANAESNMSVDVQAVQE
jgi:hypothetical protein